ncbi:MauE/DoxX family redox-associated membrane protein [Marinimicrococcus flavescens]|uniref:Methylamine utilization protein MauE n=1 Tax=Marinimicrococcus flavescens TaxID=3031815 RepID=A0AAP3V0J9_9PROT|nr:methylamine utilization protein MauE [Marinimicrococcus flavescens]
MLEDPALLWTARLSLAGIFGAAAVTKLAALEPFAGVVRNYRLLPEAAVRPVALGLPVLELLLAAGLLVPATSRAAAGGVAVLLLAFAAAMAVNIRRGRVNIDCGCFMTVLRQRLSWGLVVRNLLLVLLALPLILAGGPARGLLWIDMMTIAGAAGSLLLAYAAATRLYGTAPVESAGRG